MGMLLVLCLVCTLHYFKILKSIKYRTYNYFFATETFVSVEADHPCAIYSDRTF